MLPRGLGRGEEFAEPQRADRSFPCLNTLTTSARPRRANRRWPPWRAGCLPEKRALSRSAAFTPECSSRPCTSVRRLAKPRRIPRARRSPANASSMAAPVLSMTLIGPPSTTNHLMPGREVATSSTRFLKYGASDSVLTDTIHPRHLDTAEPRQLGVGFPHDLPQP